MLADRSAFCVCAHAHAHFAYGDFWFYCLVDLVFFGGVKDYEAEWIGNEGKIWKELRKGNHYD